ncbi:hypothetical protein Q0A08_01075 [Marinomonas sp. PE14-40]
MKEVIKKGVHERSLVFFWFAVIGFECLIFTRKNTTHKFDEAAKVDTVGSIVNISKSFGGGICSASACLKVGINVFTVYVFGNVFDDISRCIPFGRVHL